MDGVGLVSSLLMVCAVIVSLAVGVLAAHGLCAGMFRIFRMHARQVAAARTPRAQTTPLGAARN